MSLEPRNWYHGSPILLTTLSAGSTITQDKDLARVFSHKPSAVSQWVEGKNRYIKHTGDQEGHLYKIDENVAPDDVYAHPHTTMEPGLEWLTRRELRLVLVEHTQVRPDEHLSAEEVEALQKRVSSNS